MPSKNMSREPVPGVPLKTIVLELEADSTSFVTLRVKPDRRRTQLDLPPALERRVLSQGVVRDRPSSRED
jgi:hypothetical protein